MKNKLFFAVPVYNEEKNFQSWRATSKNQFGNFQQENSSLSLVKSAD